MSTKRKLKVPSLPYGAYTEIAAELKAAGRKPVTKSGVWRAIHESQNEEVIEFAAEYLAKKRQQQQSAQSRLAHALASQ